MAAATSSNPPIGGPVPTNLKAPATSSTTSESVTFAATRSTGPSRVASPAPALAQRRVARPLSSDFLSDKATAVLIRRTLCAQHLADRGRSTPAPIHDLLPPLTSRNDVDLQLYALISIIIREFVQNWYARITPDETFVAEIVQIIAHCTRALEQRLRKIDLESLLFDELPELFDAHVRAYRTAKNSAARPPTEVNLREIYHALCPLPALSPVPSIDDQQSIQAQAENESAYRQLLVQGVLAVLLPTEDLENECLTSLVGQLLSELVIGNLIANKISEPWLIWEGLIILTRLVRKRSTPEASGPDSAEASAVQSPGSNKVPPSRGGQSWSIQQAFWSVVQWAFLAVNSIRLIFTTIALSRSLPPRPPPIFVLQVDSTGHTAKEKAHHPSGSTETPSPPVRVPIVDYHIWQCIGDLLEIEARMPWLRGALSMIQWGAMRGPGKVAGFDGILDRLFSHHIEAYILDPVHLPPLFRAIRAAIFPNNAPGSSSLIPPSSDEQLAALHRRCASALLALVPKRVVRIYYGSSIGSPPRSGRTKSGSSGRDSGPTAATKSGAISRSGPLDTPPSSDGYNDIAHNTNSSTATGEEAPRVRLTHEGQPEDLETDGPDNATLTTASKRQLEDGSFGQKRATAAGVGSDHRQKGTDTCEDNSKEEDEDEAGDEDRIISEIETGILDIFSDAYCNKHLMYGILELILVRLIPELAEKGVAELWEERLN